MSTSEKAKITDTFVDPFENTRGDQKDYTKGVRIHYTVTTVTATLSGTTNGGNPFSADPEKASVTFTVDPEALAIYVCDLHARQAFEDMNDLFHHYPNSQPRKYVDFPDYKGICRFMDVQQNNGAVFLDAVLPRAGSRKDINLSAVMKLIDNLKKMNSTLQLKNAISQQSINALLLNVQTYLQGQARDSKSGKELVNKLDQLMQAFGDLTDPKKTQKERDLIRGIGTLQQLISILNQDSGANCKAPMMNAAVQ